MYSVQYDSIEMFKVYDVTIKSNTVQNVSELIDCRCDVFIWIWFEEWLVVTLFSIFVNK